MSATKGEKLSIKVKVLYLSSAGPKRMKAQLLGETVSLGTESWVATPMHRWPRGAGVKWDFVLPQGRSEALSPYVKQGDLTTEQLDALVNNNMVEQLNRMSQPRKASGMSWVQMSITIGIVLCVIGSAIYTSNRMDKLETLEKQLHPQAFQQLQCAQTNSCQQQEPVTHVTPGVSSSG